MMGRENNRTKKERIKQNVNERKNFKAKRKEIKQLQIEKEETKT